MIFPDCVPSLAVVICDESIGPLDKRLERLEKLQSQFKNAFAIICHLPENVTWNEYQMMVSGKTLRLLRTFDVKSAIKLALQCYENMKPSPKHQMQEKYFEMERERLCSSEMSRSITHKAFENMQISEEDAQLVIEGFPTIAHIMTATREEMEENSPADRDAIAKITSFFGYQTPTLNN